MKLLILLIMLVTNIYSFTLYDNMGFENKPNLDSLGFKKIKIHYQNSLWPFGSVDIELPHEKSIQLAARNSIGNTDDNLVVVDIEHWAHDIRFSSYDPASLGKLIEVIDICKKETPFLKFGYYRIVPIRDYTNAKSDDSVRMAPWIEANDSIMDLADKIDVLYPSLYTFYNRPSEWVTYAEWNISEAKRLAKGKPIYPYIWPQYHQGGDSTLKGTFVDSAFWALQLETLYNSGIEGAIIWTAHLDDTWENVSTMGWFKATEAFLDSHNRKVFTRPIVNAGDPISTKEFSFSTSASYTDDALEENISIKWYSRLSPGNVIFSDSNSLNTTISVDKSGHYTFTLTVDDGDVTGSSDFEVYVESEQSIALFTYDDYLTDTSLINFMDTNIVGIVTKAVSEINGKFDNSLSFLVDSAYVLFEENEKYFNLGISDFTIATWVKFDSLGGVQLFAGKGIVSACCEENGYPGYMLGLWDNNFILRLEDEAVGRNAWETGLSAIAYKGEWVHVAGVRSNNLLTLYINGDSVNSTLQPSDSIYSINNDYPFAIGARTYFRTDAFFTGSLDNTILYNRALSKLELQDLVNGIVADVNDKSMNYKDELIMTLSPNPFNPILNINFSSSKIIPSAIKIFDISGKLVKDLSSQINVSGTVKWHANSTRSGVYWVWIKTGNKTLVKQVTLLK